MSNEYTGRTFGGADWTPKYIQSLNEETCIGCGRCYKVCSRDVFAIKEREMDEDDDLDEMSMVMSVADASDCIGCESCASVCPARCHTHAPLSL